MNTWMEELAITFLPPSNKTIQARKLKDNFLRAIKHHSHPRTNQFDVNERLVGLEEKCQVLNLDDLAAELYLRRKHLCNYDERWVPDVLDLLLHLSEGPLDRRRVRDLKALRPQEQHPPALTWQEVEADDPISREDGIWDIPTYSDFSSDDDNDERMSSAPTSPEHVSKRSSDLDSSSRLFDDLEPKESHRTLPIDRLPFWQQPAVEISLTEKQVIQEVLLMMLGLPTAMFVVKADGYAPVSHYKVGHLRCDVSSNLIKEFATLGSEIEKYREWLRTPQQDNIMQLIQDHFRESLSLFEDTILSTQTEILNDHSYSGNESLSQILHSLHRRSASVRNLIGLLPSLRPSEPVMALNALFAFLDTAHSSSDDETFRTILPIFAAAFTLYSKPIDVWMCTGRLEDGAPKFFISESPTKLTPMTLWHNWFSITRQDERIVPQFLKSTARKLLTIGKTAAFMNRLVPGSDGLRNRGTLSNAVSENFEMAKRSPIPFCASFEAAIGTYLNSSLDYATIKFKALLEENCGLTRLLDAFEYLFLGKNTFIWQNFEGPMFDQVDKCVEIWNDRFLCAEALSDVFSDVECVDTDLITIRSAYTSSRTMESRRRSVKILGALALSYELSWPIANIISHESIAVYQKVALVLSQIRRAKFSLDRRAYFCVQNIPLDGGEDVQKVARGLCFQLSFFINTIYGHLTECAIGPLTLAMRKQLTGTIDEMISVHRDYVASVEFACLCSKRMRPLRESLISALDLCIRFTDMVSSPLASQAKASDDFEAGSFVSARSQRRRRRGIVDDSETSTDEDENEHGEGFSTFILDEDTDMLEELTKVHVDFKKHIVFLAAGLRGVARSAGDMGELFEILADKLDGVLPRPRRSFLV